MIRAPLSIFTSLRKRFPESFIPNNQSNHKIFLTKQLKSAFPEKRRESFDIFDTYLMLFDITFINVAAKLDAFHLLC